MNRITSALLITAMSFSAAGATAHEPQPPHRDAPYPYDDDAPRDWDEPSTRGWSQQIGLGGGYYAPFQGARGQQAQFEFLAASPTGHLRLGGEFTYRHFDTRLFGVNDVEVDSYGVDVMLHYVFNPHGFTPYVGAGIGLQANDLSKRDLVRANSAYDVRDDIGLGFGFFGLLGVEIPVGPKAALFAEGRLNLAYQVTGSNGNHLYADSYSDPVRKEQVEDLGGGSGVFGVRFHF